MQGWRGQGQVWSQGGLVGLTVTLWTGHFTLETQFPLPCRGLRGPVLSGPSSVEGRKSQGGAGGPEWGEAEVGGR